ncbi:hypothetical protein Sango_0485900 [Sesamum angolense]|uniref:Phytosulfokine n=1 Tax=Sesamum angolense TaxID=2727404 RepID=A0AAE1XCV7_9LAMI|nr:hypothetical protein Sango_0485900 [Sesamum angolense]
MKQRYHSVSILLFLVLLIISTSATARKLGAKQGEAHVKTANSLSTTNHYSLPNMQTLDSFNKLMGLEEYCQNGDEECFKRRAIAEAHLDYIYTQHHKP